VGRIVGVHVVDVKHRSDADAGGLRVEFGLAANRNRDRLTPRIGAEIGVGVHVEAHRLIVVSFALRRA
jgi:hypothetical protein